jgi:hypothetical protein
MVERTVNQQPSEQVRNDSADMVRARIALRKALDGKLNVVGDVSLAADGIATTTDITSQLITADSIVWFMPTNAAGAVEHGLGLLVTFPSPNVVRITHTASAAERTLRYGIIG